MFTGARSDSIRTTRQANGLSRCNSAGGEIDGFSVIFHLVSYQSVGLSTLQSRAQAGIVGGEVVFSLPGSNGAVKDGWDKVISAQLDSRHGPCNMVELMPRLMET